MVPYSTRFAEIYDEEWSGFAVRTAPKLLDLYLSHAGPDAAAPAVLDLCCGTGQMAEYFLSRGCRVTGIDRSPAMLERARHNCAGYLASGRAAFHEADATSFTLEQPVDFVTCAYDALNNLPEAEALSHCFECVFDAVRPGGLFVFDVKTRLGMAGWSDLSVVERPMWTMVTRGVYDGAGTAYRTVTGFIADGEDRFTRFQEWMTEHWYDLDEVRRRLAKAGWVGIRYARSGDLRTPVTDLGDANRVFVVAERAA